MQNNDDNNSIKSEDDELVIDETDNATNKMKINSLNCTVIETDTMMSKTYNECVDTTPEILCIIAFENTITKDIVRVVYIKHCKHIFQYLCIIRMQFRNTNTLCPNCRRVFESYYDCRYCTNNGDDHFL